MTQTSRWDITAACQKHLSCLRQTLLLTVKFYGMPFINPSCRSAPQSLQRLEGSSYNVRKLYLPQTPILGDEWSRFALCNPPPPPVFNLHTQNQPCPLLENRNDCLNTTEVQWKHSNTSTITRTLSYQPQL